MRIAWLSDLHLDYLFKSEIQAFKKSLLQFDQIWISGDISNGKNLLRHLKLLSPLPIYFVNGNHDYYGSSFAEIQLHLSSTLPLYPSIHYLPHYSIIQLSETTGLFGLDGWYDGQWKEPLSKIVFGPDFFMIKEFNEIWNHNDRLAKVRDLAFQEAQKAATLLQTGFQKYDHLYFVTHFPPWPHPNPSWRNWKERFWHPFNSSKVMAETILAVMQDFPDKKLTIICGHLHLSRETEIAHNINLKVAGAKFRQPMIQEIIEIP